MMIRIISLVFISMFLTSCGVDTSSSDPVEITNNPISDDPIDPINPNPINPGDPADPSDPSDPADPSDPVNPIIIDPGCEGSIYQCPGAIFDAYACTIGNVNNGYTSNVLKDTSNDYLGASDEEYGLGVNSRYSYNADPLKTEVALFYYTLKTSRSMDVVSIVQDNYTISIDTGWADNDEKVMYVRTPQDGNDLYGCYRYDVSFIDINRDAIVTKVYN